MKFPEFRNPEIPLEEALNCIATQSAVCADALEWNETPGLFAQTILPWINYLQTGGYHPVPVLALTHFLVATEVPSVSAEMDTIIAEVELEYALERERGPSDMANSAARTRFASGRFTIDARGIA